MSLSDLGIQSQASSDPIVTASRGAIVHMTFGKFGGKWWLKTRRNGRMMEEFKFDSLRETFEMIVRLYRENENTSIPDTGSVEEPSKPAKRSRKVAPKVEA